MIGNNTGDTELCSRPLSNCCQVTSHLGVTLGSYSVNVDIHDLSRSGDYFGNAGGCWQSTWFIKAFYYYLL